MTGDKDFSQMSVEEMIHYMRIGTKKEEMFHALRSGSGMKGILNTAYTCLGNPVTVCDTSFSILENCPAHANDMDFEIRNHKQYMKTEAVLSMHREKLVERIFSETEPFTYFRDALGIDMMYCQIAIKKSVVGYVCVLAKNRAFIADDYEIVAALAQMLSVEMQKSSFFTEKAGFKYEYFLTDLIEGNMSDPAFIKQRMIQLGRKPLKNYWLLAVMFEQEKGIHISHQYYLEQLLTIVKNSTALFYKGHIVMLVSADENQPYGGEESVKIRDFLTVNHMVLAISHRFTEVDRAPEYYRQTTMLLALYTGFEINGRVLKYEDYVIECLFGQVKKISLDAAVHPDLKLLIQYDAKNKTEYFRTLKTYIESGRHAGRSIEKLHIHKSTFFYRMGKISGILGTALDEGEKLFQYETGIKLLKMKQERAEPGENWLLLEGEV